MSYTFNSYESMLFGEDGETPILEYTLERVLSEAKSDKFEKIFVRIDEVEEVFVKRKKQEKSRIVARFAVSIEKSKMDIANQILERLNENSVPFNGVIRMGFYSWPERSFKYGSFNRRVIVAEENSLEERFQESLNQAVSSSFWNLYDEKIEEVKRLRDEVESLKIKIEQLEKK